MAGYGVIGIEPFGNPEAVGRDLAETCLGIEGLSDAF